MDIDVITSLSHLRLTTPANNILEFNVKTLSLTNHNLQKSIAALPTEVLLMIYSLFDFPGSSDEQVAKRVLNINVKHSDALQVLLVCRKFYQHLHEYYFMRTIFIVRSRHRPQWDHDLYRMGYFNPIEEYTRLMSPNSRSCLTNIMLATTNPCDIFDRTGSTMMKELGSFLPCIKWLPNLQSVTLVNVSRHVWREDYPGDRFLEEYKEVKRDMEIVFRYLAPAVEFCSVGNQEYTISWLGQPAPRPQQKIVIAPGVFVRQANQTILFRGLEQDFGKVPRSYWENYDALNDAEMDERDRQIGNQRQEQKRLQDAFEEKIRST
jgi:hypothetical protein